MLSSVLRSERAVLVNIEIMRVFVRLRRMLLSHEELAAKLAELESRYDGQFRAVFEALRELMENDESPPGRIGFRGPDSPGGSPSAQFGTAPGFPSTTTLSHGGGVGPAAIPESVLASRQRSCQTPGTPRNS
jgi:hypothetical protein